MQTFFSNRAALAKGDCVTTHPKHVSFIIQFAKISYYATDLKFKVYVCKTNQVIVTHPGQGRPAS